MKNRKVEKFTGVVVIDIDGIIADFEGEFCDAFGYDNRHEYDLYKRYPNPELVPVIDEFVSTSAVYQNLFPLFSGNILIRQCVEHNLYVVLMTSRPEETKNITKAWLERFGIPYNELVFAKDRLDGIQNGLKTILPVLAVIDDSVTSLTPLKGYYTAIEWQTLWSDKNYYPKMRYNSDSMKVEVKMDESGKWKYIWE